jgi:predicted RNA methylase
MNRNSFTPRNLNQHLRLLGDSLRGLDFINQVESEEVGLDPRLSHASHPSGNKFLAKILRDMKITEKDSIIDIGCGKGSAMRTMLKFPFARVDGVDIAKQLTDIAERNFKKINDRRVQVFQHDAATFEQYTHYNVIYFYNPFPACIMEQVMQPIIRSARERAEETLIIYNNPTCNEIVVGSGYFSRLFVYPDEWRNGIFIYSNRSGKETRLSR